ncbi:MAG: hypothetical protein M3R04_09590 [bacterium]|nr:hypothetical protein [bacterium]
MLAQIDTWETEQRSSISLQVSELDLEPEKIAAKLRRLKDLHVDGEIEKGEQRLGKQRQYNEW